MKPPEGEYYETLSEAIEEIYEFFRWGYAPPTLI
tara:strand:+ start:99 stop:200 length:102 start_codon:yes stop_codon:yes gene_type:complete